MSLFSLTPAPWNIALSVVTMIVASALAIDACWMGALVRGKDQPVPPPLFRTPLPIRTARGWAGLIAAFVLGIAPLVMQGVTGVRRMVDPTVQTALLVGVAACAAALLLTAKRRTPWLTGLAGGGAACLILAPYALAGPTGWSRYAMVVGLTGAIVLLLFLTFQAHRLLALYRPRTRWGAGIRLLADAGLAVGAMTATFWPGAFG